MSNYKSYTEKELLQLLSNDDRLAFGEIYDRLWKPLFAIAYNRLKELQAAEDIVQDVFASLWKNRHAVEADSVKNYLAAATKYMVLAKIKRMALERRYQQSAQLAPVVELNVDGDIDNKRLLQFIKTEVETLPEKCRLIFQCSRDKGMSAKEIATEFNISAKTVENQLNKALRHLRKSVHNILHTVFFL